MCGTTRTICAILENYQTEADIVVPEALRAYIPPGMNEILKFVKPAPMDDPLTKEQKKTGGRSKAETRWRERCGSSVRESGRIET